MNTSTDAPPTGLPLKRSDRFLPRVLRSVGTYDPVDAGLKLPLSAPGDVVSEDAVMSVAVPADYTIYSDQLLEVGRYLELLDPGNFVYGFESGRCSFRDASLPNLIGRMRQAGGKIEFFSIFSRPYEPNDRRLGRLDIHLNWIRLSRDHIEIDVRNPPGANHDLIIAIVTKTLLHMCRWPRYLGVWNLNTRWNRISLVFLGASLTYILAKEGVFPWWSWFLALTPSLIFVMVLRVASNIFSHLKIEASTRSEWERNGSLSWHIARGLRRNFVAVAVAIVAGGYLKWFGWS